MNKIKVTEIITEVKESGDIEIFYIPETTQTLIAGQRYKIVLLKEPKK